MVRQRSVLGTLFVLNINDLDDNITSNVLEFANNTNVLRKIKNDGDEQHLQNDIETETVNRGLWNPTRETQVGVRNVVVRKITAFHT